MSGRSCKFAQEPLTGVHRLVGSPYQSLPDSRKDSRSSQFLTNLSVMTPSMTLLKGPMSLRMFPTPPCQCKQPCHLQLRKMHIPLARLDAARRPCTSQRSAC